MKKRKIVWSLLLMAVITGTVISCSEDFTTIKPAGLTPVEDYYKDEGEALSALASVYDLLRKNSGGFDNMIIMMNSGSDDFLAGGGNANDGQGIHDFEKFRLTAGTIPGSFWSDYYQGIFRANQVLSVFPSVPMDEAKKARFIAEARTLRAYYYFELVTLFRNIPLITETLLPEEIYSVTQSPPADIYAFIETELSESMNDLPMMITDVATEGGRLTKGSAQAILGKVYLYEGKKTEAAAQFAEVNGTPGGVSQYGYHLLPNYADLWVRDNDFNAESIIEVSHSQLGRSDWTFWGSGADEGNTVNQMVGPRGYQRVSNTQPDFWSGWSFNPVLPGLVAEFEAGDPRKDITIFDMTASVSTYNHDACYDDTGYWLRKFMPLVADVSTDGGTQELNFRQNTYIIRLADSYLMEAEALNGSGARAQSLLDAVRARAGMPSVPVSMNAIWHERRVELAGEGFRFFDLVRSGQASSALGSRGFTAGVDEIFPIPQNELNNTQLVQNPGF
ncbi:RagB/SusD family nutrient uptake outer membrane protein [Flavobacterium silvaticum]|uniref:RagB/SusD family nutrient uptake outer membrane protein n=1 Tax=Flavobacterium silvaticum TaxID=1852020 RepID=A0A972FP51_9FLAO|nr:RagB/SusD family nutrient uptake outer membrane protein [Flavobacterium silvaticum]NMH29664.1 RagB/SusD family nutrient uptake outer membrane protein [Flavobacterium silvaticum]